MPRKSLGEKSLNDSPLVRLPSDPPAPAPSFTSPFQFHEVGLHFSCFIIYFLTIFFHFLFLLFFSFFSFYFVFMFSSVFITDCLSLFSCFYLIFYYFFIFYIFCVVCVLHLVPSLFLLPRLFPLVSIRCRFTVPSDFEPVFLLHVLKIIRVVHVIYSSFFSINVSLRLSLFHSVGLHFRLTFTSFSFPCVCSSASFLSIISPLLVLHYHVSSLSFISIAAIFFPASA